MPPDDPARQPPQRNVEDARRTRPRPSTEAPFAPPSLAGFPVMRAASSPLTTGCARRRSMRPRTSEVPRVSAPARVDHPDLPGPASGRSMYGTHSRRRSGGIPVRDKRSARSRVPGPATARSASTSSSSIPGSSSMRIGSASDRSIRRLGHPIQSSDRAAPPIRSSRMPMPRAIAPSTRLPFEALAVRTVRPTAPQRELPSRSRFPTSPSNRGR